MHDSFTDGVIEFLTDLQPGDTFAGIIENRDSSLGPRTEYFRVETTYGGINEPSNQLLAVGHRCSPSEDYWIPNRIYATDDLSSAVIKRLGPADIDILAVSDRPLCADYSSTKTLIATCSECLNSGQIPVSEDDLPLTDPILLEDGSNTITACCHSSEYTVSLDSGPA